MKTVSINIDDEAYSLIESLGIKNNLNIQDLLELAINKYFHPDDFVSDDEMLEILDFSDSLDEAVNDMKNGRITLVEE